MNTTVSFNTTESRSPMESNGTRITVIPGDGIGPEVTAAVLRILDASGARLEYEEMPAGLTALESHRNPLPEDTLEAIDRNRVVLKGPLTTPVGTGFRSINVAIRKEFDLFANVRPAKTMMPGGRYEDLDLVLVRENTEGLYVGVEHYIGMEGDPKAAAESVMIITRFGADRIVRFAMDLAEKQGRKRVTLAHKANILKYTQGLFLDVGREVAKDYEGRVSFDDKIIDATAMALVLDPGQFEVLVTENMFGDILSDLMAGLIGGLGLAPAGNIGATHAMFEAVHGSAPDIAGQGVANPSALLLASCMLLDHVQQEEVGARIRTALQTVLNAGAVLTRDLGGTASTREFADEIVRTIEAG